MVFFSSLVCYIVHCVAHCCLLIILLLFLVHSLLMIACCSYISCVFVAFSSYSTLTHIVIAYSLPSHVVQCIFIDASNTHWSFDFLLITCSLLLLFACHLLVCGISSFFLLVQILKQINLIIFSSFCLYLHLLVQRRPNAMGGILKLITSS